MKKGPLLLIIILVGTLSFIIGVNYGKQLTVTDQAVKEIMKLLPTIAPTSIPTEKDLSYNRFSSITCGVSFVIPTNLDIIKTGASSARIETQSGKVLVSFTCDDAEGLFDQQIKNIASSSALIAGEERPVYFDTSKNLAIIRITRPRTDRSIVFSVDRSVSELILSTLTVIKK